MGGELLLAGEQVCAACLARVRAGLAEVLVLARARALGAALAQDLELERGQHLAPLLRRVAAEAWAGGRPILPILPGKGAV